LISLLIIRNIFAGASTNVEQLPMENFDSSALVIDEIQILLDKDLDMTNSGQHSSCPSAQNIVGEGMCSLLILSAKPLSV
jgi:hypothetical protein